MISDDDKKNKKKVKKLLIKYFIKHVIVLTYNSQTNEMIERKHQFIINALFKLMNEFIKHDQDDWVSHFFSVLLADCIIIQVNTDMTLFCMMYGYEAVLLIELDVPTWQTLSWNLIKTHSDLIAIRACQIEHQNQNIEKASTHLQQIRLQEKKYYDQVKNIISKTFKESDLILLHNTQDKISYSTFIKMKFQ